MSARYGSPAARLADDIEVLVPWAGQVDQDKIVLSELSRQWHRVGNRMRALQRWNDALQPGCLMERGQRLLIGDACVLGALLVVQEGVLGPNAGVIQAGGDGMRRQHLAVLVLEQVAERAVQHAGTAAH